MLSIGLVQLDGDATIGLAAAARRHPGISVQSVAADGDLPQDVDAVIVEAPVASRTQIVKRFSSVASVLTESPINTDNEQVVSVNPLRYALHTRRLIEEVRHNENLLETIFVGYRFRRASAQLAHALDLVQALQPGEIEHVASLERDNPSLMLASLRYSSGTLVSLELGNHLPAGFPSDEELVVECFSNERAYHCMPGNQSVSSVGARTKRVDWQPDVADAMVAAFVDWLNGGSRPPGTGRDDLIALELAERIRNAARS
jgi:predicted dehydrogenase